MIIRPLPVKPSPLNPDYLRCEADVLYEHQDIEHQSFWFDFPKQFENDLSSTGNAWLTCLLPLAVRLGEPLRLNVDVDQVHYDNALKLIEIWTRWYSQYQEIPVEVKIARPIHLGKPDKTLAFYSAGIDSAFTLYQHRKAADIDDLVMILGFDIPIQNAESFKRKLDRARGIAEHFHKEMFSVTSNLRETKLWHPITWGNLAHGSLLAAVGLLLEKRYRRVLIPSGAGIHDLKHWGSHTETDPLYSTSQLAFIHDGAEFSRIQKCEAITASSQLMGVLHVCNRSGRDDNCARCEKCLRTLVVFDILGHLKDCRSFQVKAYDPQRLARLYIKGGDKDQYWYAIQRFAQERGRPDLVRLIDEGFGYTEKYEKRMAHYQALSRKPLLWRWGHWGMKRLKAKTVF